MGHIVTEDKKFAQKIAHVLVTQGIIAHEEAEGLQNLFFGSEHANFDDFLLEQGLVSREDLLKSLSILYQIPPFDVTGFFFHTNYLRKFPKDFLHRNGIIPINRDENMLIMVATKPNDAALLPKISEHVSYDIRFFVGIRSDITAAISEYYETSITEDLTKDRKKLEMDEELYERAKRDPSFVDEE